MSRQFINCGYLNLQKTIFLLCDVQESFRLTMKHFQPMVQNIKVLIDAGKAMDIPLFVTEQYPDKLGHTIKDIDIQHAVGVFPKIQFSMITPEVKSKLNHVMGQNLQHVVLFGIATHVCVEQTVMDLRVDNIDVHIAANCCISNRQEDRYFALERMKAMGCLVTSSESIIFKLLKDKNSPHFNQVRKLVFEESADTELVK